jgi:O-antigen ligase
MSGYLPKILAILFSMGLLISDRWLNNNLPGMAQSHFILPLILISLHKSKIELNSIFYKSLFFYIFVAFIFFLIGGLQGGPLLGTLFGTVLISFSLSESNNKGILLEFIPRVLMALTLLIAMAYYFGFWENRKLEFDGARLTFMENNENIVAQQLCLGFSFFLFYGFTLTNRKIKTILFVCSAFFIIPALATISRTGAGLLVFIILIFSFARFKFFGLGVALFFTLIAVLSGSIFFQINFDNSRIYSSFMDRIDETGEDARFDLWDLGIKLAKENFFTGVGFGNFSNIEWRNNMASNHYLGFGEFGSTHNTFLDLIHIGGIWLLIPYLVIIIFLVTKGVNLLFLNDNFDRFRGAIIVSCLTSIILFSQTGQAAMDKLTWFQFAFCYILLESKKVKLG